jgi:hypothetical protein
MVVSTSRVINRLLAIWVAGDLVEQARFSQSKRAAQKMCVQRANSLRQICKNNLVNWGWVKFQIIVGLTVVQKRWKWRGYSVGS